MAIRQAWGGIGHCLCWWSWRYGANWKFLLVCVDPASSHAVLSRTPRPMAQTSLRRSEFLVWGLYCFYVAWIQLEVSCREWICGHVGAVLRTRRAILLHEPCILFLRHFHTIPELELQLLCRGNVWQYQNRVSPLFESHFPLKNINIMTCDLIGIV